jgi:hypothetical protein
MTPNDALLSLLAELYLRVTEAEGRIAELVKAQTETQGDS